MGRLLVWVRLVQVGTKKSKSMLSMLGDDTLDPNIPVEEGQVGTLLVWPWGQVGLSKVRLGCVELGWFEGSHRVC